MKLRFTGVFNTLFLKVLELEEKDKMFSIFFFGSFQMGSNHVLSGTSLE